MWDDSNDSISGLQCVLKWTRFLHLLDTFTKEKLMYNKLPLCNLHFRRRLDHRRQSCGHHFLFAKIRLCWWVSSFLSMNRRNLRILGRQWIDRMEGLLGTDPTMNQGDVVLLWFCISHWKLPNYHLTFLVSHNWKPGLAHRSRILKCWKAGPLALEDVN